MLPYRELFDSAWIMFKDGSMHELGETLFLALSSPTIDLHRVWAQPQPGSLFVVFKSKVIPAYS